MGYMVFAHPRRKSDQGRDPDRILAGFPARGPPGRGIKGDIVHPIPRKGLTLRPKGRRILMILGDFRGHFGVVLGSFSRSESYFYHLGAQK